MAWDTISEHIDHCHKIFRYQIVVLLMLPLNNNVKTLTTWRTLVVTNRMIHEVLHIWNKPTNVSSHGKDNGGDNVVLVQEFEKFTNQILWENTEFIGYNISMSDFTQDDGMWEEGGAEEFLLH